MGKASQEDSRRYRPFIPLILNQPSKRINVRAQGCSAVQALLAYFTGAIQRMLGGSKVVRSNAPMSPGLHQEISKYHKEIRIKSVRLPLSLRSLKSNVLQFCNVSILFYLLYFSYH